MSTKAKSDQAPKSTAAPEPYPLAAAFAKAVKLVDSGKHAEAAKMLESLIHEAEAAGDWAVKRRAQVYLALADSHLHPAKAAAPDAVTEIQACLNRRDTAEALKLCEKALKARPEAGVIHYLRAVACAQADNIEGAADSLKAAINLDADLVYQWHMEPDFNAIRKSPLFGFTEGR